MERRDSIAICMETGVYQNPGELVLTTRFENIWREWPKDP